MSTSSSNKVADSSLARFIKFYDYCERKVRERSAATGKPLLQRRSGSGVGTLLGNATAIFIAETLAAPFERLKILLQVRNIQQWTIPKFSNNLLVSIKSIAESQGNFSLFRGLSANLYKQFLLLGCSVAVYDQYKYSLQDPVSPGTKFANTILAVAFIGTFSSLISYPFDFAHTRLAMDCTKKYDTRKMTNIWDHLRAPPKIEKLRTAYQGLPIQLVSSLLYTVGISSALLISSKRNNGVSSSLLVGITASLLEVVLYPIDTFKRCFQASHKPKYDSLIKELELFKNWKNFKRTYFAGLPAHLARIAIMMTVAGSISSFFVPKLQRK